MLLSYSYSHDITGIVHVICKSVQSFESIITITRFSYVLQIETYASTDLTPDQ